MSGASRSETTARSGASNTRAFIVPSSWSARKRTYSRSGRPSSLLSCPRARMNGTVRTSLLFPAGQVSTDGPVTVDSGFTHARISSTLGRVSDPTSAAVPEDLDDDPGDVPPQATPAAVGQRLRDERQRQRIGLRELARRVGVSASLISQIELGRATPSVGTLYTIVNELNLSLDELFFDETQPASPRGAAARSRREEVTDEHDPSHPPVRRSKRKAQPAPQADGPLVRSGERQSIHLGSGVTWERMSPPTDHGVDFLYVVYEV